MAVTMAEITKLRKISGAGMMDCKNALTEANGDIDKAMEIIRKKGQAVAAKRSDREASEGCVLAKKDGEFAAIIALKCETDFVAKNADFVALTQAILDAAVANRCKHRCTPFPAWPARCACRPSQTPAHPWRPPPGTPAARFVRAPSPGDS